MNTKRIVAGIVAMVATAWAVSFVGQMLNLDRFLADPISGGLGLFLSALVGSFVARSRFVLPALSLWLVLWVAIIYVLYRIAGPVGAPSVIGLLSYNAIALIVSLVGAYSGAVLGQHLSRRLSPSQPAAT